SLLCFHSIAFAQDQVFPGANEKTPSRAQYFSWINNTNEGPTEAQTLINLNFFKWLKEEYGMQLDIYAFDAGAIDGAGYYGSVRSQKFKSQFPRGFKPVYEQAKRQGVRLGIWGGPDGFGNTPEEEKERIDLMVGLAKNYEFELFKFDGVCGNLRPEKQDAFIRMMTDVRKYSPNLILLNHRLNLGKGLPHATTWLWEGAETYTDVHMQNRTTAPHHRQQAMARGLPPNLSRLTEDHGVCLSSALDFWDDELVLQAFNRSLILAPEIYGNPWLLKDNEYPKLARIFNLHKKYNTLLVNGMVLPEKQYGPHAVSRGDDKTRVVTLRNLSWEPVSYSVELDKEIGLGKDASSLYVYQYHPSEKFLGKYETGSKLSVEVLPFRSALLVVRSTPADEITVEGTDFEVVKNVPGKDIQIRLLGLPGTEKDISLSSVPVGYKTALLDGKDAGKLLSGNRMKVNFPGAALQYAAHRNLGELKPGALPADAEALYEATCFSADNNALEVRSLYRSGDTKVKEVKAARDAFFKQALFTERGIWDKNLFDGSEATDFYVSRRWNGDVRVNGGAVRVDFGQRIELDSIKVIVGSENYLQPLKSTENVDAFVSADLTTWTPVIMRAGKIMQTTIPGGYKARYLKIDKTPERISEIVGYKNGKKVNRMNWRASNLFSPYWRMDFKKSWQYSTVLTEIPDNSYLALAVNGRHGAEGVYAALKIDGKIYGFPDRSVSYPSNAWEVPVKVGDSNYTFYFPLTAEMKDKQLEVFLLGKASVENIKPELWITNYPYPYKEKMLIIKTK
ncbi:MAG TPA: hypothetical protein VEX65_06210, partial [Flavisolibacter sp.]|nr:hypothetical protein [Flavisolibacter sp.]